MDLILWRHAEAEDGMPDLARALTRKGHKQASRMADWLKPRLPEDTRILVSPAQRAQQTAAALGRDFSTLEALAPAATPEAILDAAAWPHHAQSALIVGHQPTLGEVAALLLDSRTASLSIRKGAIWWFATHRAPPRGAVLKAVLIPEFLPA